MLWRVVAVLCVLAVAYAARAVLKDDGGHPRSRVQRVALVQTNRPLPPPKPIEKPPELQADRNEVAVSTPAPASLQQPDSQLGVDADGEGAGDGFGLVGKRGGQDITTLAPPAEGPGGSGAGLPAGVSQFNHGVYAGTVRQRLQTELAGRPELREQDHVTVVLLWIDAGGRVERVELQQSSGSIGIDMALRRALAEMPTLPEPPFGLPLPLRMRITSKDLRAVR